MINNIFWDLIVEDIIIVYLDDILISTWMLEEHYRVVYRVLEVLAEPKLFFHPEKCEFDKLCIEYLGLVISEDQVEMDFIKDVRAHNWPILTTYTDLQMFLGFTNFY